jgi:hypothetical protein
MKRFLGVLIASMFLASAAYAAEEKTKGDEKTTEAKDKAKDGKAKAKDADAKDKAKGEDKPATK